MKTMTHLPFKLAALAQHVVTGQPTPGISFLIYHKVGGTLSLEIDLPHPLLRRQLQHLALTGRVVSYERALALLQGRTSLADDYFVLTFDDAYQDFYTDVFPLLRQLRLPAILYVPTGFVEEGITYPLAAMGLSAPPVTWEMLGEMHESGLVTIAAHTHTHPRLVDVPPARVLEELARPLELFQKRLGFRPRHFAYPEALWNEAAERAVKQYYDSAVIGTGRSATPADFHPYRIPRLPIRRSDGWFFFRAKLRGWLAAEEDLYRAAGRIVRR